MICLILERFSATASDVIYGIRYKASNNVQTAGRAARDRDPGCSPKSTQFVGAVAVNEENLWRECTRVSLSWILATPGPNQETSIPTLTPKSYELCEHARVLGGARKRRIAGSKDEIFEARIETVDGRRTQ